jgi:hypothetical protein
MPVVIHPKCIQSCEKFKNKSDAWCVPKWESLTRESIVLQILSNDTFLWCSINTVHGSPQNGFYCYMLRHVDYSHCEACSSYTAFTFPFDSGLRFQLC